MINKETEVIISHIKQSVKWSSMIGRFNDRYSDFSRFSNAMLYIIQSIVNDNEDCHHLKRSEIDTKLIGSLFFKTTH